MNFLKGNYKIKKKFKTKKLSKEEELEKIFEENAKKRIGGSMVYVSKKKVNWDLEEQNSKLFFQKLQKKLGSITNTSLTNEIYRNILRNSKIVKKHFSIKELKDKNFNNSKVALIVAGGPSLRKKDFRKDNFM